MKNNVIDAGFSPPQHRLRARNVAEALRRKYPKLEIFTETDKVHVFAGKLDADILMAASTGTSALLSVLGALRKGRRVALANA